MRIWTFVLCWLSVLLQCTAAGSSNTTEDFVVNDFMQVFQSTCGQYISAVETCPLNISSPSTWSLRRSAARALSECYTSSYNTYFACSSLRHPDRGMALVPIHSVGILPEMSVTSTTPTAKPIDVHGNATCSRFPSLVNVLRESCNFDYGLLAEGNCCSNGEAKESSACETESFNVLACGIQSIRSYVTCTSSFSSLTSKNVTESENNINECVRDRGERVTWLLLGFQVEHTPIITSNPLKDSKCNSRLEMIAVLACLNAISLATVALGNWRFWRMLRSKYVAWRRGLASTGSNNSTGIGSGSRTPPEVIDAIERHVQPVHHIRQHHLGKIEEEDNNESPASDDIEEVKTPDDINETASRVEDFPSRGNSTRADTRKRHSAILQKKNQRLASSGAAPFKFYFLLVYVSIALQVVFNVGVAEFFKRRGVGVIVFAQFTAFCLRPRSSFFIGVMGLLDAGWMGTAVYSMITDIALTGLGGIMLAMSGVYNLYPQNPAKPETLWNVFNVGAVLSLLPTGILFLTLLFILLCLISVILKQFKDDEWAKENPAKTFLVPWYATKRRGRIAWKRLASSCTPGKRVSSVPATRFSSWVKVGYYGLMGCTFLTYIGNWTFWIGYLALSGPLYCPQDVEMIYIMGFGLMTALTIVRVIFEL